MARRALAAGRVEGSAARQKVQKAMVWMPVTVSDRAMDFSGAAGESAWRLETGTPGRSLCAREREPAVTLGRCKADVDG